MKKLYLHFFTITLLFFISNKLPAQLSAWSQKDRVLITQTTATLKVKYQVLLTVNTEALVSAGKMKAAGEDIRFAKDCQGSVLYDYWIESGMNSNATRIWVKVDSIPASGQRLIYMFYGNTAATAASSFENTFPDRLIITGPELLSGTISHDWVEITPEGILTLQPNQNPGSLGINARKIIVAGQIIADGAGYNGGLVGGTAGGGPGGGKIPCSGSGGGGGGYGNSGGRGSPSTGAPPCGGAGGDPYGTLSATDIQAGSGGAAGGSVGAGNVGGNGGGAVSLIGTSVDISGSISCQGLTGTAGAAYHSGGGGAGGGVLVRALHVSLTGSINVNGGTGGVAALNPGGGGAGGRVKIFYESSLVNSGTISVLGGAGGVGGSSLSGLNGTEYSGVLATGLPSATIQPHVLLSAPGGSLCEGELITLMATGTGFNAFQFLVNSTMLQNSSNNAFTSASLRNGDLLRAVAIDANGCPDTSNSITLLLNPGPTPVITGDLEICSGESTSLSASGGGTYQWNTGQTSSTVSVNPMSDSEYSVTVTVSGCSAVKKVMVKVNPLPVAAISGTLLVCPGSPAELTATGGSSYDWSTGETTAVISVNPLTATAYTVSVTDANGCRDSESVQVDVFPAVQAAIQGKAVICPGDSTTLMASGGISYSWKSGESSAAINVSPSATTIYEVVATSPDGCVDTAVYTVSLSDAVQASITGPSAVCQGAHAVLTAEGGTDFLWSTGDNVAVIEVSPTATTTYQVTVTNLYGCKDSVQIVLEVLPPVSAYAGEDTVLCVNKSTMLQASGGISYQWSPPEGLSCTTCPNPVASPTQSTTYTVEVGNADNCKDTDDVTITIDPCTGIGEEEGQHLEVSRKAAGMFALRWRCKDCEGLVQIQVLDQQGKLIFEKSINQLHATYFTIDLTKHAYGLYFFSLRQGDQVHHLKLVNDNAGF